MLRITHSTFAFAGLLSLATSPLLGQVIINNAEASGQVAVNATRLGVNLGIQQYWRHGFEGVGLGAGMNAWGALAKRKLHGKAEAVAHGTSYSAVFWNGLSYTTAHSPNCETRIKAGGIVPHKCDSRVDTRAYGEFGIVGPLITIYEHRLEATVPGDLANAVLVAEHDGDRAEASYQPVATPGMVGRWRVAGEAGPGGGARPAPKIFTRLNYVSAHPMPTAGTHDHFAIAQWEQERNGGVGVGTGNYLARVAARKW